MSRLIWAIIGIIVLALIIWIIVAAVRARNNPTVSPTPSNIPSITPSAENTADVDIRNMSFNPSDITVFQGTSITWTNNDNTTHTVNSDTGVFSSGNIDPQGVFQYTFNNVGQFPYHCNIHPNMKGTVTVQASPSSDPTN